MNRRLQASMPAFLIDLKRHRLFDPLRGEGLKALALKGSIWTLGGFGGQKFLQLASNLILTRLLFPEAFGLMSLVNVVIAGLGMFSDVGIMPAIVQDKRGEDRTYLNTAWTIQIIRGFALWFAACLLAWPAAQFYGEPALFPLLCVAGATSAITGLQTTALAVANRQIKLARLTLVQLGGQAITIAATVTLAWLYESVWALAIGSVIGAVVQTVLGHVVLPSHGHALRLEPEAMHSLFRFGRWIFLATLITFLGGNGMQLVTGKLVSVDILGKLAIAGTIGWALGDLTNRVAGTVGFPALASISRREPARMRSVINSIRVRLLSITLPGFILLSLVANPLVNTLYDARYAVVGDYLAITAIVGAIAVLPMGYQNAFLAAGNSRVHFIVMSAFMVFRLAGVVSGFYLGGAIGLLLGNGVATLAGYFVSAKFARDDGWLSPRTDAIALTFVFVGACLTYFVHVGVP